MICSNGARLLDVSDPDSIWQISYVGGNNYTAVHGVDIQGRYAYLAYYGQWEGGIGVVNISDIENPEVVSHCNADFRYLDIEVRGDYVYALGYNCFHIFDISDPEQPFCSGQLDLEFKGFNYYSYNLLLCGDFVYASTYLDGIKVLDVSDPENPQIAAYYDTPGITTEIAVHGNLIYVADRTSLGIYRNALVSVPDNDRSRNIAQEFTLYPAYPNPFNSTTMIRYSLPLPSQVSLQLFDLSGRIAATIFEGQNQAGIHTTTLTVNDLPTGLYFVRLNAGEEVLTQKIMLIK